MVLEHLCQAFGGTARVDFERWGRDTQDLSHSKQDKRVFALCSEFVEKNVRIAEIEDPSIWGSWLSLT